MTSDSKGNPAEVMARMSCADHGYRFCALVDDVSGDEKIPGFTYVAPGQDMAAPSWVSLKKSCWQKWDGSAGA